MYDFSNCAYTLKGYDVVNLMLQINNAHESMRYYMVEKKCFSQYMLLQILPYISFDNADVSVDRKWAKVNGGKRFLKVKLWNKTATTTSTKNVANF